MSNNVNKEIANYQNNFFTTLKTDGKELVLKVPFENYQELCLFQSNIIKAIEDIGKLQSLDVISEDIGFTIQSLTHVLKCTSMFSECQAMDEIKELQV